jgi:hypothetical protein
VTGIHRFKIKLLNLLRNIECGATRLALAGWDIKQY